MNEYARNIKKIIDEEIPEAEFPVTMKNYLINLKRCVKEKDYESFNVLSTYYLNCSFGDINPEERRYNSDIRQYLYKMILHEKYEFMKSWTDHEFAEIANTVILNRMERNFNDTKLGILSKEDVEQLKESFLITMLEFSHFTLLGMLNDEWYFSSIKEKIETYIYYTLSGLELMTDALLSIRGTGRDYIPNRLYRDEMFEYATNLYNNGDKRLKQEEVIIDTLKKYGFELDKFDSFRVRWGIYKRGRLKNRKQPFNE